MTRWVTKSDDHQRQSQTLPDWYTVVLIRAFSLADDVGQERAKARWELVDKTYIEVAPLAPPWSFAKRVEETSGPSCLQTLLLAEDGLQRYLGTFCPFFLEAVELAPEQNTVVVVVHNGNGQCDTE